MYKRIFFLLSFLVVFSHVSAQKFLNNADTLEFELFPYQVKQIDEFMQRFNGEIDAFDKKDSIMRKRNIVSLFNEDYLYSYTDSIVTFINDVTASDIKLHYQDSNWWAIAECDAIMNKKKCNLTLLLKTEEQKKGIYKWVIADAHADFLELKPLKINDGLKIPPTNNEVNFSYLSHITTIETLNILNFSAKEFQVDELSVFFALVQQKLLKIEMVKNLTYHFDEIAGYSFDVAYFNREMTTNSGWLIYRIQKQNK